MKTVMVLALLAVAIGCRPDDQRTETMDAEEAMQVRDTLPAGLIARLDSGSAAFRAGDYEGALSHYKAVTEEAPDVGAGWFGVYMAEDALGHDDEAAEALERVRALVPGATLIHENAPGT